MRKLLFILSLLCPLCINAQKEKLCPEMNAFYEYCLDVRAAEGQHDYSALEMCIAGWDGEGKLLYKGVDIKLGDFPNKIEYVDRQGLTSLKGHLLFDPFSVDSVIANGPIRNDKDIADNIRDIEMDSTCVDTMDIEEIDRKLRGGPCDCYYTQMGIKAGKQVSISLMVSGKCELFIVSEDETNVTASIILNNNKKESLKETSSAPCFKWEMENQGKCVVTVKNPSDKDISVIVVSS